MAKPSRYPLLHALEPVAQLRIRERAHIIRDWLQLDFVHLLDKRPRARYAHGKLQT
jgi:hypothetical protein